MNNEDSAQSAVAKTDLSLYNGLKSLFFVRPITYMKICALANTMGHGETKGQSPFKEISI